MKMFKLRVKKVGLVVIVLIFVFQTTLYAHSGRTDSSGGHKDNKNASGLGNYHYHCGGNPPHLHEGGVCPYGGASSGSSSSSNKSSTNSSSNSSTDSTSKSSQSSSSSSTSSKSKNGISASNSEKSSTTSTKPKSVDVTAITIDKSESTMLVNESIKLTAKVSPDNATNKAISWESSNNEIETVSDGTVYAKKSGIVTITVKSSNGLTDTVNITIKEPVVDITNISLDSQAIDIEKGGNATIVASVYPENATDKTIDWKSSDENIAKVVDEKIVAVGSGEVDIIAESKNGIKSVCKVTVREPAKSSITEEKDAKGGDSTMIGIGVLGAVGIGTAAVTVNKKKRK